MLRRSLRFESPQEVRNGEDADDGGISGHRQMSDAMLLHERACIG